MNMPHALARGLFGWPRPPVPAPSGLLCAVGAPSDTGNAVRRGAAAAPDALRAASSMEEGLADAGWDIGDLPCEPGEHPEAYMQRLSAVITQIAERGHVPLLLGGDHSLSFAAIEAVQEQAPVCVVWLDAHTDFSPWQPGSSHQHRQVLRRVASLPGVTRLVQVGYRGITVGDERALGPQATVFTTQQVRACTAAQVLAEIPRDMRCYLSLDVDVLDPQWVPGTSAPVPDGLDPAQVMEIILGLVDRNRVVGLDVMELNPRLDIDGRSSALCSRMLADIARAWPRS